MVDFFASAGRLAQGAIFSLIKKNCAEFRPLSMGSMSCERRDIWQALLFN
jgi:hypothetical protein